MVGGGIQSTNVFAALDSLKKKKKRPDKGKDSTGWSKKEAEPVPAVFWAPTPLNVKSWADVDDDDDYYATAAPPEKLWGSAAEERKEEALPEEEESESEDEGIDDGIDNSDVEELDHEPALCVPAEPVLKKPPPAPVAKDTDRQLSKKELKKKELAELEAVLAELGLSGKDNTNGNDGQEETCDAAREKKSVEQSVDAASQTESKTSKRKKAKKDKSSKEVKESHEQLNLSDVDGPEDNPEPAEEEKSEPLDVKERLKKMAGKKKKSSKETDAAPKAVKIELAARRAKLEAAKKKEKIHYNQQPVR